MRKRRKILVILTALALIFTFTCGDVMAVSTRTQGGNCLAKYKLKKFKTVANPAWNFVKKAGYKRWEGSYYNSAKGSTVKFKRWLRVDYDNPQSIAVTPNGQYMFIMNTPKGQKGAEYNRKGYIWRIDLAKMKSDPVVKKRLKEDGVIYVDTSNARKPDSPVYNWFTKDGQEFEAYADKLFDADRKAAANKLQEYLKAHPEKADLYEYDDYGFSCYDDSDDAYGVYDEWNSFIDEDDTTKAYNHEEWESGFAKWAEKNGFVKKEDPENDEDYIYRKYFHHSAKMVTGHGQTMAYNPKTKKLWYLPNMKQKKCKAVMVDPMSLKQEAIINFKLKSSVQCPSTLTFDKRGYAYCYSRTTKKKKKVPAHVAKIYKGTLSPTRVSFQLVMKGLRWAPGTTPQGIGYNPKSDRLYLVSDRSIVTVPVGKILNAGKPSLQAADVKAARWSYSREFEGISFDNKGNGYFLTNKPDEVMLVSKDF